jgi:hypothetical protein
VITVLFFGPTPKLTLRPARARASSFSSNPQSTPLPFSCKITPRFPEAIAILDEERELRDQL